MKHLTFTLVFSTLIMNAVALADTPAVVTRDSKIRIWVDQIGYRTSGKKMAVVASDSAIPDGIQIELRDAKSNKVVWRPTGRLESLVTFNDGNRDEQSGDFVDQLDFSNFTTAGRYYFVLTPPINVRSYQFSIAANPYYLPGRAAWKAYYYSRADGEIPEKYGGLWTHGNAFLGPNQATQAKIYRWKEGNHWPEQVGTEVIGSQTYDVHGGWWDAGDLNKYTSNTATVVNMLYMAYEMMKAGGGVLPKDKELNIPESGNGIPDVLDEIRHGTEFLIRDDDGTGAAFGRVHQEPGSPPDTVKAAVQLTMPNSETTMGRAAALAYAAVVWRESKLDNVFAEKCYQEAKKSWDLLIQRPAPWPVDPQNPGKILSQGEMRDDGDYETWRTIAAASFFRLTRKPEFDAIVHQSLATRNLQEKAVDPSLWIYMHCHGADPALIADIHKAILASADETLKQVNKSAYRISTPGFWWGSNSTIAQYGTRLVLGSLITDHTEKKTAYLDGAENFVHYLYGRNPRGECYFSNMKSFGVEKSAVVMFHSWVGNVNSSNPESKKYIGEGPNKIGPFPAYVIGGPHPDMKHLIEDEDLDWRKSPWEWTEPDIGYQSEVVRLLDTFIWPAAR